MPILQDHPLMPGVGGTAMKPVMAGGPARNNEPSTQSSASSIVPLYTILIFPSLNQSLFLLAVPTRSVYGVSIHGALCLQKNF
jgi:hypothetical protein